MATAKHILSAPPRRRARAIAALVALAVLAALAWFWQPLSGYAMAGASYGARIGCACRFLQGREISACRADFERGMAPIVLSADEDAKSVTARFPLLARQTAAWREGEGCRLEKWD